MLSDPITTCPGISSPTTAPLPHTSKYDIQIKEDLCISNVSIEKYQCPNSRHENATLPQFCISIYMATRIQSTTIPKLCRRPNSTKGTNWNTLNHTSRIFPTYTKPLTNKIKSDLDKQWSTPLLTRAIFRVKHFRCESYVHYQKNADCVTEIIRLKNPTPLLEKLSHSFPPKIIHIKANAITNQFKAFYKCMVR